VSNSAKRKVEIPKTERQMYRCTRTVFTHFPVLYGVFVFFVNTYHHDHGDGDGFLIHRRHYSRKELKDETLSKTGGKDYKDIFHWPYFLSNPSVLREGTPSGEDLLGCCLSHIWTLFELRVTRSKRLCLQVSCERSSEKSSFLYYKLDALRAFTRTSY